MKNINRKHTVPEMCDGCIQTIGPVRKESIDGVNSRDLSFCSSYEDPSAWYRRGDCPMRSTKAFEMVGVKGRVGQQKGKKKTRKK